MIDLSNQTIPLYIMNLSEIQKRLDAQNRILNAWLLLGDNLQNADVVDKSELTIEVVRANINRVCANIDKLQIEQRKLVLKDAGIDLSDLC